MNNIIKAQYKEIDDPIVESDYIITAAMLVDDFEKAQQEKAFALSQILKNYGVTSSIKETKNDMAIKRVESHIHNYGDYLIPM